MKLRCALLGHRWIRYFERVKFCPKCTRCKRYDLVSEKWVWIVNRIGIGTCDVCGQSLRNDGSGWYHVDPMNMLRNGPHLADPVDVPLPSPGENTETTEETT